MTQITIWKTNEEFEIKEENITSYNEYEEAYQLEDGRWIGFEDGISAWVMLG